MLAFDGGYGGLMHGHLLGAAGAVELVATLLALTHGTLPPTMNLLEPDPECDLDYVANAARTAPHVEYALTSSFAFGGTNAVLACRRTERIEAPAIREEPELAAAGDGNTLFVGSAFTSGSLYRLDLTQPGAPIVAEDLHRAVSGTDRLGLNVDASLVALTSGQIVRATDFSLAGLVRPGVARFSADGELVIMAASVRRYVAPLLRDPLHRTPALRR